MFRILAIATTTVSAMRVVCSTHWSVTPEMIRTSFATLDTHAAVENYVGGPTRLRSRCDVVLNHDAAAHALACELEVAGRRCRVFSHSAQRRQALEAARARAFREVLEAATADERGPDARPAAASPPRGEVLAAIEALDDADQLSSAADLALATASLVAIGEVRRANALFETRGAAFPHHPAARGAGVAALCAAGKHAEALDLARDADLDARGFNSAIAAAEAVGDFNLAYAILQRRAEAARRSRASQAFQREALKAKRDWLSRF